MSPQSFSLAVTHAVMADCGLLHPVVVDVVSWYAPHLSFFWFKRRNKRDSACMCEQTQLTWMRSETGLTLMNLPIKESMQSPKGCEHHYHVGEMQKEGETMGESIHWLVETFFFPICNSVNLSEADSNLSVFCYGA